MDSERLDLEFFTALADMNRDSIKDPEIAKALDDAVQMKSFSRMAKLHRIMTRASEEEAFLLEATRLLL